MVMEKLELSDAAKAIIVLLEDRGLDEVAYWERGDNILVYNNGLTLEIDLCGPEPLSDDAATTIYLYLISGEDRNDPIFSASDLSRIIDCTEVNLVDPQSINIIEEWIEKLQHGHDRSPTGPSL